MGQTQTACTYTGCPGGREYYGGFCYNNCKPGYSHYTGGGAASYQWCHNDKRDPTWGRKWDAYDNGYKMGQNHNTYRYSLRGAKTLYDLVKGNPNSATADFRIPLIPNKKERIVDPQPFPAQCKCLKADGTVDTQAYYYNGTCVKCANPNQVFYATGGTSTYYQWSEEQKNKFLSIYNDAVTDSIDQHPFVSLNDAKSACEADPQCSGVTRSVNASGTAYYYKRAGTTLIGTPPPSGGSATSSAAAGSMLNPSTPTMDSSWTKQTNPQSPTTVPEGLRKGTRYSKANIPTAFADDYLSPTARGSSIFSYIPTTVTSLVNSMTNEVLQAASAWASFENSVQNPNTYYQLVGVERQLVANTRPPDNGICVGPCDPKHTLHDPIQMIIDQPTPSDPALFVLYGTTCHDATETIISKPSIPGVYTPQVGANCPAGYDLNTGGSCVEECESNAIDNGSSCNQNSMRRPSTAPALRCPPGLDLVGGVCLHPCEPGYTQDGDFCQPIMSKVPVPSTINCVSTPYSYSSKYQGSASSVSKWLCDSSDDQAALLAGPSGGSVVGGTTAYVNSDDIVCYADDATTGMYYCQSVPDALSGVNDTERTDYSTSCDTMTHAYMDLSNNLTSLLTAQTTAQNSSAQIAAIQGTLDTIIKGMCGSNGSSSSGSSTTCNALRIQLAALNSNINSGSGAVSGVLSPISVATSSRDSLITLLHDMKCCPPGGSYPWCDTVRSLDSTQTT